MAAHQILWGIIIFIVSAAQSQSCLPSLSTCDFYTCLESKVRCNSSGYPIDYGYKYCQKFSNISSTLTKYGTTWLRKTRYCLQDKLKDIANNAATRAKLGPSGSAVACKKLKSIAFDSHPTCYLSPPSICGLTSSDQIKIARAVDINWTDLRSTLRQMGATGMECIASLWDLFIQSLIQSLENLFSR